MYTKFHGLIPRYERIKNKLWRAVGWFCNSKMGLNITLCRGEWVKFGVLTHKVNSQLLHHHYILLDLKRFKRTNKVAYKGLDIYKTNHISIADATLMSFGKLEIGAAYYETL